MIYNIYSGSVYSCTDMDIDYMNKNSDRYLFNVCLQGNNRLIKYLLTLGTDIKNENTNWESPLHYACLAGNETTVKYLIDLGADMNEDSVTGCTPLFYACISGNKATVKYLVEQGADIKEINCYHETPIFFAFLSGNIDLIDYLIELGGDDISEATDKEINTPFLFVCKYGDETHLESLIREYINDFCFWHTDHRKNTILHIACEKGYEKIVEF
eukprot:jgi/Orpsp1_1/1181871/evm.model.c7180000078938.1